MFPLKNLARIGLNQTSNSQQAPHGSPSQANYGGVYYENFEENWPHDHGTALYF